jgi:hypothetical protein
MTIFLVCVVVYDFIGESVDLFDSDIGSKMVDFGDAFNEVS